MISVSRSFVRNGFVGVVLIAALVALSSSLPAAEEASGAPAYILLSESTIPSVDAGAWAKALAITARAHAEHEAGTMFATYRRLTGGPDEEVRVLFPFDRMGDLDAWGSNRQVLFETVGPERGQLVLDDLELASESAERILAWSEKLSRPRDLTQAPRYLWVVEVEVEEGRMVEYAVLAVRLREAHDRTDSPQYWLTYGNALGGERSQLTYLYGFEEFASLDAWPPLQQVLTEAYGAEEAQRLAAALEGMARTTRSVWALERSLSQME